MGYLDEAIRDHLELQRRRGVPADEIERAEAEALGNVGVDALPEPVSERLAEEAPPSPEDAEPANEPVVENDGDSEALIDQPTQAFTLKEFDEAEGADVEVDQEGGADDVLEATPDFLQETPEHDRLWFEQKPPKDFDFS